MPARESAGILLHRAGRTEVLLVHPGGPFWRNRDAGAWSIPKGEVEAGEAPQEAALREFGEETGTTLPDGALESLGAVRLKSGKVVHGFAVAGDLDPEAIVSTTFDVEWPPRSGRMRTFPEVDRAGWFGLDDARDKLNPAQAAFVDRLADGRD
jgi:predicted NUDIX family NTP pyrophosphohydrolase